MKSFGAFIAEDLPYKLNVAWIADALQRSDVDDLYVHGSRSMFSTFRQPDTSSGQLIFFSKLTDIRRHRIIQALYYGPVTYLCTMRGGKEFDTYRDLHARAIAEAAIPANAYDRDRSIQYNRLSYEWTPEFVPPAVKAGYNRFQIYEISMQDYSYAVSDPNLVSIVDRFDGRNTPTLPVRI